MHFVFIKSKQAPVKQAHLVQLKNSVSLLEGTYMYVSDGKDNVQRSNWKEKLNQVTHSVIPNFNHIHTVSQADYTGDF